MSDRTGGSITSDERRRLAELFTREEHMTTPTQDNAEPTPHEEQHVDLVVELTELQDQVAELKASLDNAVDDLAKARMDAAAAEDARAMAEERLVLVQRMIISAQHSEKQWKETAIANDKLHNAACDELNKLRAKVTVQDSMIEQLTKQLEAQS